MPELYNDLERIYSKVNESLKSLERPQTRKMDNKKLIAWMKESLQELGIYVQALVENQLAM